jgi:ribonuclease P protein component
MAEPRERFPASSRLRRTKDFQRASRVARKVATDHFVLLLAPRRPGTIADSARLGVTVSRRVGPAVTRNRVKRAIREWFRRTHIQIDPQLDLVVIARPSAARMLGREIARELGEAFE